MGCTASQVDDYMYEPSQPQKSRSSKLSFSDNYFTARQKQLLRQTWTSLDNDPVDIGTNIFLKIFHSKPETKALFPFGKLSGEQLLSNSLFRSHALRFIHAIGSVVKNLDALDLSCGPILIRLGKKHAWITDFVNQYLDVFKQSTAEVFQEELGPTKCNSEVLEAWSTVFSFIAVKMNEGYEEAFRENQWHNRSILEEDCPPDSCVTRAYSQGSPTSQGNSIVHRDNVTDTCDSVIITGNNVRKGSLDHAFQFSEDNMNRSEETQKRIYPNERSGETEIKGNTEKQALLIQSDNGSSKHEVSSYRSGLNESPIQGNKGTVFKEHGELNRSRAMSANGHHPTSTSLILHQSAVSADPESKPYLSTLPPSNSDDASLPPSPPETEALLTNDLGSDDQEFNWVKANGYTGQIKDNSNDKNADLSNIEVTTDECGLLASYQTDIANSASDNHLTSSRGDSVRTHLGNESSPPCLDLHTTEGLANGDILHTTTGLTVKSRRL